MKYYFSFNNSKLINGVKLRDQILRVEMYLKNRYNIECDNVLTQIGGDEDLTSKNKSLVMINFRKVKKISLSQEEIELKINELCKKREIQLRNWNNRPYNIR